MATQYTKSLSGDFTSGLKPHLLKDEIEADAGIVPVCTHIDTSSDVVEIWFDSALSAGEQTTLNGLVTAHDGSVEEPKEYPPSIFKCWDEQATNLLGHGEALGTEGFTNAVWHQRVLNTSASYNSKCTLSSNRVRTNSAGKYEVSFYAPCGKESSGGSGIPYKGRLKIELVATPFTVSYVYSCNSDRPSASDGVQNFLMSHPIELSQEAYLSIEHYNNSPTVNSTFGTPSNIAGVNEIYATMIVKKIGD